VEAVDPAGDGADLPVEALDNAVAQVGCEKARMPPRCPQMVPASFLNGARGPAGLTDPLQELLAATVT
jgi:hypothetical protein